MADNILWKHIEKRLRLKIGDEAYTVWKTEQSPVLEPLGENNEFTIRVTGHDDYQTIGQEIAKILTDMGFENPSVQFQSGRESVVITADPFKDIYEEIVRPDRALSLPGYIQRWVSQELGVDAFFFVASLKQGAYDAGFRGDNKSVFTGRFSAKQIAARAGISTRTYWHRMADQEFWRKLKGLVTKYDEPKLWTQDDGGKPRQAARRFSVFGTMPLTPRDTARLHGWIIENIEACGGPEGVLRAAVDTPVNELIGDGSESQVEDAKTVLELVLSIFGDQIEADTLSVLASSLHRHIIPTNDIIKISHFFLENILPAIGPSAGYLITMMRDRCFVNQDVRRTTVTFKGGWDELAASAGLTGDRRAKTAWEWFNAKYPYSHKDAGKLRNAVARLYLSEVIKPETELDFEHQPRTFQVEMDEIPRGLLEAAVTGKGPYAKILSKNFCTHSVAEIADDPIWGELEKLLHTRNGGLFPYGANFCTHDMADFSLSVRKIAQLKALKLLNQLLNTNQPTPAEFASEPTNAGVGKSDNLTSPETILEKYGGGDVEQPHLEEKPKAPESVGWSVFDFSKLARTSNINPSRVKYMAETVPNERERTLRFVGWLLHAHSPKGKGLKDETGVGLAISSIGARPGNAFLRLARLGPDKLRALFDADFTRTLGQTIAEEMIYRANLKHLPLHRKQDLYYRLFELDAPEPAAATAKNDDAGPPPADGATEPKPAPFDIPRREIKVMA